ncbi:hypothetical protein AMTRI_Chr04g247510 [Amborella trichopoda]
MWVAPPGVRAHVRTRVTPVPARIRIRLTSQGWGRMHPSKVTLLDFNTLKHLGKSPRPLFGSVWNRPLHDLQLHYAHMYGLGCMNPLTCL